MRIEVCRVAQRAHLDVQSERLIMPNSGDRLLVAICSAGSTVTTPPGVAGLWWPIHGKVVALTADTQISLDRQSIYISDSQRGQDISIESNSSGIGLIGSQAVWKAVASLSSIGAICEPALFPAFHAANLPSRQRLLSFVREVIADPAGAADPAKLTLLASALGDLQGVFEQVIARCLGRNAIRQRTVFMRLQRIRNYLSCCIQPNVDVKKLALMANYSVWRFIKVFFAVFGETPYAYISRCHIERARRLLQMGNLCIGDVALVVGFENRSTLTRAIKRHYGLSATQLRHAKDVC
jgi:AraC family transcriptional regulator